MIIAFDTYYYDGYSYTVGGIFESWASNNASYYVTSKRKCTDAEYDSGELYKLSCIMQCISMIKLDNIDAIIINGFAWLSDDGKELVKGLGAKLFNSIKVIYGNEIDVIGISKSKYHVQIPNCLEVTHGIECKVPLYITCSNIENTNHYSVLVSRMHGDFRIPTILRLIDTKARELKGEREKTNEIGMDFTDLDEWADRELKLSNFNEWMKETEKNGFRCL